MQETDRILTADEGEETMVAPRFDDEETMVARPVVPFEEVGTDAPAATPHAAAPRAPVYSRLANRPRRSLVAALVLVSALAGGVLGGAGLYLYQKQRQAAPASQPQAEAPAPEQQPTAAPEALNTQPASETKQPPQVSEPAAPKNDAAAEDEENDGASDEGETAEARPAAAESAPPVERRRESEASEATRTTKRGKKGTRDEEVARSTRRANRDEDEDYRDEASGGGRVARRVGVITYRPRRVRPRRDNYGSPDRLRRIFEGQP